MQKAELEVHGAVIDYRSGSRLGFAFSGLPCALASTFYNTVTAYPPYRRVAQDVYNVLGRNGLQSNLNCDHGLPKGHGGFFSCL